MHLELLYKALSLSTDGVLATVHAANGEVTTV